MFRRLFWFVAGAVAGVTGLSWLKRRADQVRATVASKTTWELVRDTVVIGSGHLARFAARVGLRRPPSSQARTVRPAVPVAPAARRHIASRPRNTHG